MSKKVYIRYQEPANSNMKMNLYQSFNLSELLSGFTWLTY